MLDWEKYILIADRFQHKAKSQDRQDLRQDIILSLAEVASNNGDKPLSEVAMFRIASVTVMDYWRQQYRLTNGLDCGNCSQSQRHKCDELNRYEPYYRCPKLIEFESLDKPIADDDGNLTEKGELIADDKAIDLDLWLDAKTWLKGCPKRLVVIAGKIVKGLPLDLKDRLYLCRWRQKELKKAQLALSL